ncbi:hypothetical protein F5Y08DRAFT_302616 [Xylaria arbuscula]|nr:hypothetical protein F5Y08DRAFT_302616 [Xylaria arbuscula]
MLGLGSSWEPLTSLILLVAHSRTCQPTTLAIPLPAKPHRATHQLHLLVAPNLVLPPFCTERSYTRSCPLPPCALPLGMDGSSQGCVAATIGR